MQHSPPAFESREFAGSATTTGVPPFSSEVQRQPASLAPWYHTLGIVLLLLLYSFVSHLTHRAPGGVHDESAVSRGVQQAVHTAAEAPHVPLYLSTIMLSWMLLASVVAGLYRRRAFFRTALCQRFRSFWMDAGIGAAIYLGFLATVALLVMLITGVFLLHTRFTHAQPAGTPTQSSHATDSVRSLEAEHRQDAAEVHQRVEHMLHVNRKAIASLAPRTVPQLLLWCLLSFTAGFCEEHIFRGYLLRQALAAAHAAALPRGLGALISVVATSLLFGCLHLYEGAGGALLVGLLGAIFATLALVFGNLRAVIIAHFLQDFIVGFVQYLAHVRHAM